MLKKYKTTIEFYKKEGVKNALNQELKKQSNKKTEKKEEVEKEKTETETIEIGN
jgi:predicted DNA-binding protein YlxM (UPF0122 family)